MASSALKQLRKWGYCRDKSPIFKKGNKILINKDLNGAFLNHMLLEEGNIEGCNLSLAAVTGSIFKGCTFKNNIWEEPDFEFCEFSNCDFYNDTPIKCSYNNSNFLQTYFHQLQFSSCTFTNTLFEGCHFVEGTIEYSTLENSSFQDCHFVDIDLANLNMDFVELSNPHMRNVTLSLSQIPFMYGCLEYLLNTKDNVRISNKGNKTFSPKEYFKIVIPEMKKYFTETQQFFPLANIYLCLNEEDSAIQTLKNGISNAIEDKDFRMLKYYCYLIAKSKRFLPEVLHMFYNNICKLSPQGKGSLIEQRNYAKHIGEIKAILFQKTDLPNLNIAWRTNLFSDDIPKMSCLLKAVLSLAKKDIGYGKNQVSVLISENSPIVIELQIRGAEEGLIALLRAFAQLDASFCSSSYLLPETEYTIDFSRLEADAQQYKEQIVNHNIQLCLTEYYMSNFEEKYLVDKPRYYYNSTSHIQLLG